jgi:hypothetical protein
VSAADGAICGTGKSCNAGACVNSRAVTGTRRVTYWPDAGPQAPVAAPDVRTTPARATVKALVPAGNGGWSIYPGTFAPDGSFNIPNVPAGNYVLQLVDASGLATLVEASASSIDLGYDQLGRSSVAKATASTLVTIVLRTMNAWNPGDQVQIASSNADIWGFLAFTPALVTGARTGNGRDNWFNANATRVPINLLASTDTLNVYQLVTRSDGGKPYQAAAVATSVTGTTLANGGTPTWRPLSMSSPASSRTLSGGVWAISSFEALRPAMNVAVGASAQHSLIVGASVGPLIGNGPAASGSPTLLSLWLSGGTTPDPTVGNLTYARPLNTTLWNEWRGIDFTAHTIFIAPGSPAPAALDETVSVGRREPMVPPPTTALAPDLSPVQSVQMNGVSATGQLTAVGATPTISWTAPATGSATSYAVDVFWLHATAGASTGTRVATWITSGTSVVLPPGLLVPGNTYYARIIARNIAGESSGTAPFRRINTGSYAGTLTGTFAP